MSSQFLPQIVMFQRVSWRSAYLIGSLPSVTPDCKVKSRLQHIALHQLINTTKDDIFRKTKWSPTLDDSSRKSSSNLECEP